MQLDADAPIANFHMSDENYEQLRGHGPDFVVAYRLYAPDEGGRKVTYQHLRCDFCHDGDDPPKKSYYMAYPEFLDDAGDILAGDVPVALSGRATMWIMLPESRAKLQSTIDVGSRGYFMEGSRKIGELRVEAVLDLHENPT